MKTAKNSIKIALSQNLIKVPLYVCMNPSDIKDLPIKIGSNETICICTYNLELYVFRSFFAFDNNVYIIFLLEME